MRDLFVALVLLFIYSFGFVAPFVFTLCYEWADLYYPQMVAEGLLETLPISLIAGVSALLAYLADRRSPPRFNLRIALIVILAIWVTLTTTWAVAPAAAWFKWNWAFKTVAFCAFIPFSIRSRVQIEAFLMVYIFALAGHLLPVGLKTLAGSGGYGLDLSLLGVNRSAWSESSNAAAGCVMMIPLILAAGQHSVLLPYPKYRRLAAFGLAMVFIAGGIGTFARTGLIGFVVLGTSMWLRARRKVLGALLGVVVLAAISPLLSAQWEKRMSTIETYQSDSSAYVRVLVWKWTWEFAKSHPLGGGFNAYYTNEIVLPGGENQDDIVQHGRAFHNMYFEWLGEHGYPGLVGFVALLALCLLSLQRAIRKVRDHAELQWAGAYAKALQLAILVEMVCSNFVGIGFQASLWYLLTLSICLTEYVRRSLKAPAVSAIAFPQAGAFPQASAIRPGLAVPGHAAQSRG